MSRTDHRNPYPFHTMSKDDMAAMQPPSASTRALWALRQRQAAERERVSRDLYIIGGTFLTIVIGLSALGVY